MNDNLMNFFKKVVTFLLILVGGYIVVFISPLLTTEYVEYMAICLAIIFHAAVVYLALTKSK